MLVLNTTSPRASPSAPAAAPLNHVPSSSASIASTLVLGPWCLVPGPSLVLGRPWSLVLGPRRKGRKPRVLFAARHLAPGTGNEGQTTSHRSSEAVTLFVSVVTMRMADDQRL